MSIHTAHGYTVYSLLQMYFHMINQFIYLLQQSTWQSSLAQQWD